MVLSHRLTEAEIGVIQLLLHGMSNKAMAETLTVSIRPSRVMSAMRS